jgi:hypothetical protein
MPTPTRQLLSQTHYLTDGSTTLWDFSFEGGYLDKDHVEAYSRDAAGRFTYYAVTEASFVTDFRLSISPAVPAGEVLVILRNTPRGLPLVDWKERSTITRTDLNLTAAQAIFIAAETDDRMSAASSDTIAQEIANATTSWYADLADEAAARAAALAGEALARTNAINAEGTARAAALEVERLARVAADSATATQVGVLAAAVSDNTASIVDEQTARVNADGALASQISTLSSSLTNEVSTRTSQVQSLTAAMSTADSALAARVSSLESAVIDAGNGDSAFALVQQEANTRAAADSAQASRLDTLEAKVNLSSGETVKALIQAESTARANADTAQASTLTSLSSTVTSIGNRVTTAEGAITGLTQGLSTANAAITTEANTRAAADTANAQTISNVSATVTSQGNAIGTLTGLVTGQGNTLTTLSARVGTEESARANGDSANATSISNVSATVTSQGTRLSTVEGTVGGLVGTVNTLSANVTNETNARVAQDLALASSTSTVSARVDELNADASGNLVPDRAFLSYNGAWNGSDTYDAAHPSVPPGAPSLRVLRSTMRDYYAGASNGVLRHQKVTPGDVLDFEVWVGLTAPIAFNVGILCFSYDQNKTDVNHYPGPTISGNYTGWRRIAGAVTVPANVHYIVPNMFIGQGSQGVTAFFAAPMIRRRAAAVAEVIQQSSASATALGNVSANYTIATVAGAGGKQVISGIKLAASTGGAAQSEMIFAADNFKWVPGSDLTAAAVPFMTLAPVNGVNRLTINGDLYADNVIQTRNLASDAVVKFGNPAIQTAMMTANTASNNWNFFPGAFGDLVSTKASSNCVTGGNFDVSCAFASSAVAAVTVTIELRRGVDTGVSTLIGKAVMSLPTCNSTQGYGFSKFVRNTMAFTAHTSGITPGSISALFLVVNVRPLDSAGAYVASSGSCTVVTNLAIMEFKNNL